MDDNLLVNTKLSQHVTFQWSSNQHRWLRIKPKWLLRHFQNVRVFVLYSTRGKFPLLFSAGYTEEKLRIHLALFLEPLSKFKNCKWKKKYLIYHSCCIFKLFHVFNTRESISKHFIYLPYFMWWTSMSAPSLQKSQCLLPVPCILWSETGHLIYCQFSDHNLGWANKLHILVQESELTSSWSFATTPGFCNNQTMKTSLHKSVHGQQLHNVEFLHNCFVGI